MRGSAHLICKGTTLAIWTSIPICILLKLLNCPPALQRFAGAGCVSICKLAAHHSCETSAVLIQPSLYVVSLNRVFALLNNESSILKKTCGQLDLL
jgi:hypothetical protein